MTSPTAHPEEGLSVAKAHLEGPLAVSLGDPAGVGPELICEAWARREAERLPPFLATGGADVLRRVASMCR